MFIVGSTPNEWIGWMQIARLHFPCVAWKEILNTGDRTHMKIADLIHDNFYTIWKLLICIQCNKGHFILSTTCINLMFNQKYNKKKTEVE